MGFAKLVFLCSLSIALSAIILQKYYPDTMDVFVSNPTVHKFTLMANKMIADARSYLEGLLEANGNSFNPFAAILSYQSSGGSKEDLSTDDEKQKQIEKDKINIENVHHGVMTQEELSEFDGKMGNTLYLAMMGHIFDVSSGDKYYGPGGGYSFFAGRDASRAFVTGQFDEEGLTDDIEGLSTQDYLGLDEWLNFYKSDYKFVGKLVGRYFDKHGQPTDYQKKTLKWIADAKQLKANEDDWNKTFPPCNSEWSADKGSRVWCTTKSGGIERNWAGVPRKLFTPGKPDPRCACVKDSGDPTTLRVKSKGRGNLDHPQLMEYEGCPPTDTSCNLPKE